LSKRQRFKLKSVSMNDRPLTAESMDISEYLRTGRIVFVRLMNGVQDDIRTLSGVCEGEFLRIE